jgi:hypothetical protein
MQTRFYSLKYIGSFLKFAGLVSLILGIITIIVAPLALSESGGDLSRSVYGYSPEGTGLLVGIFLGVLLFFIFTAGGVLLFALGECCRILIAIEENTRAALPAAGADKDKPARSA